MSNHNCNTCTSESCKKGTAKAVEKKATPVSHDYAFYSRVLHKPFDSIAELTAAENAYYEEQLAAEAKASAKNSDAQKVEEAFKALNVARKTYHENLEQLTEEYGVALTDLKKAFEVGRADLRDKLADAEVKYNTALKEFTDKHPEYTLELRDGDTVATISSKSAKNAAKCNAPEDLQALFDLLFF